MMGLVESSAIGVVAELLDHRKAEIQLRRPAERTTQAVVAWNGLIGNGAHDRYQFAPELGKERADQICRHAFLVGVDQRVGDMLIGRKKASVFAAEINGLFQER
jgi:hypothetical protein